MSSEYYSYRIDPEVLRRAAIQSQLERELNRINNEYSGRHDDIQSSLASEWAAEQLAVTSAQGEEAMYSGADDLGQVRSQDFEGQVALEEFDFSAILHDNGAHYFEEKFREVIKRISGRRIVTAKDAADKRRLIAAINEMLRDDEYDVEQKLVNISERIDIYLSIHSGSGRDVEEARASYHALCILLQMEEKPLEGASLLAETDRLKKLELKRREQQFIRDEIADIMSGMGLAVDGMSVLDGMSGEVYSDGDSSCDIFMSLDGSGIMMETVAKPGYSEETVEKDIKKSCGLQAQIEAKARERGIIMHRAMQSIPTYSEVVKSEELVNVGDSAHADEKQETSRRHTAKREKYMNGD